MDVGIGQKGELLHCKSCTKCQFATNYYLFGYENFPSMLHSYAGVHFCNNSLELQLKKLTSKLMLFYTAFMQKGIFKYELQQHMLKTL